ncbi:MAG: hypothetical protein ACJAV5_001578 [Vicingaceae bacterium]|jgi:hypothetical protein
MAFFMKIWEELEATITHIYLLRKNRTNVHQPFTFVTFVIEPIMRL